MEGRGLVRAENCVAMEPENLKQHVTGSHRQLLTAVRSEKISGTGHTKQEVINSRKQNYKQTKFIW